MWLRTSAGFSSFYGFDSFLCYGEGVFADCLREIAPEGEKWPGVVESQEEEESNQHVVVNVDDNDDVVVDDDDEEQPPMYFHKLEDAWERAANAVVKKY